MLIVVSSRGRGSLVEGCVLAGVLLYPDSESIQNVK